MFFHSEPLNHRKYKYLLCLRKNNADRDPSVHSPETALEWCGRKEHDNFWSWWVRNLTNVKKKCFWALPVRSNEERYPSCVSGMGRKWRNVKKKLCHRKMSSWKQEQLVLLLKLIQVMLVPSTVQLSQNYWGYCWVRHATMCLPRVTGKRLQISSRLWVYMGKVVGVTSFTMGERFGACRPRLRNIKSGTLKWSLELHLNYFCSDSRAFSDHFDFKKTKSSNIVEEKHFPAAHRSRIFGSLDLCANINKLVRLCEFFLNLLSLRTPLALLIFRINFFKADWFNGREFATMIVCTNLLDLWNDYRWQPQREWTSWHSSRGAGGKRSL